MQTKFSNFYCTNTSGIDAFSDPWDEEVAWICPSIQEITRIVRKLKISRMTGVVFVPKWKTADYWVEIFDDRNSLLWPFSSAETCRPFIVQGTHNPRSPFSGRTKFDFLQLHFNSRLQRWFLLDLKKNYYDKPPSAANYVGQITRFRRPHLLVEV